MIRRISVSELTEIELIPREIVVAHQNGTIGDRDLAPNIAATLVAGSTDRAQMSTVEIIDRWQGAMELARLCADEYLQVNLVTE
jgi:hypothetical protein